MRLDEKYRPTKFSDVIGYRKRLDLFLFLCYIYSKTQEDKMIPKNQIDKKCLFCGKTFAVKPSRTKTAQYCCLQCKQTHISRNTAEKRGNILRYRGEGKTYVKYRGRHLHRVIAEEKLGRPLLSNEVVHHLNGDYRDNRPENIVVITRRRHGVIHSTKNRKCSIPGCQNEHVAKGYCNKHYKRAKSKAAQC